jgi:cell division protein FtsL
VIVIVILIAIIFLCLLLILYLLDRASGLKIDISRLQALCLEKEKRIEAAEKRMEDRTENVNRLSTHDSVLEMHQAGETVKVISQTLGIPEKKVEMTLKIEEMKKDGAR